MIGMTNAGGGGTGCTLTITAPAGAAITVTNTAGKVKSKTVGANGLAVFRGLTEGKWTITITNGTYTATKTVEIKADYSTEITFFSATINITYPAGLTCTATDGVTTLTAPDTSGTWACVVLNAGQWTVKLSTGFAEKVTVGASGESHTVNKWYVYKDGDQRTELTGGWTVVKRQNPTVEFQEDRFAVSTRTTENQPAGMATTTNALNLKGFKTLCAAANMRTSLNSVVSTLELGISKGKRTGAGLTGGTVYKQAKVAGEHGLSVDISGVGEDLAAHYPYFNIYCCNGELYKMWLEV